MSLNKEVREYWNDQSSLESDPVWHQERERVVRKLDFGPSPPAKRVMNLLDQKMMKWKKKLTMQYNLMSSKDPVKVQDEAGVAPQVPEEQSVSEPSSEESGPEVCDNDSESEDSVIVSDGPDTEETGSETEVASEVLESTDEGIETNESDWETISEEDTEESEGEEEEDATSHGSDTETEDTGEEESTEDEETETESEGSYFIGSEDTTDSELSDDEPEPDTDESVFDSEEDDSFQEWVREPFEYDDIVNARRQLEGDSNSSFSDIPEIIISCTDSEE